MPLMKSREQNRYISDTPAFQQDLLIILSSSLAYGVTLQTLLHLWVVRFGETDCPNKTNTRNTRNKLQYSFRAVRFSRRAFISISIRIMSKTVVGVTELEDRDPNTISQHVQVRFYSQTHYVNAKVEFNLL